MKKIELHSVSKKQLKQIHTWLRAAIQLLYFIFIPSVYTAAFAGVKYIFTQIGAGGRIEFTSFVTVLILICLYTILFGRFSADLPVHLGHWEMQYMLCTDTFSRKSKRNRF